MRSAEPKYNTRGIPFAVLCFAMVILQTALLQSWGYPGEGGGSVQISLEIKRDPGTPVIIDPDAPLYFVSSDPQNNETLYRPVNNVITIRFNREINISDDPPVAIRNITTDRLLNMHRFRFDIIESESGDMSVLRIRENGKVFLKQKRLPGRPYPDGYWFLITPTQYLTDSSGTPIAEGAFELYLCTLIGDINGNGEVEEMETNFADSEWGSDAYYARDNVGNTVPSKPSAHDSARAFSSGDPDAT